MSEKSLAKNRVSGSGTTRAIASVRVRRARGPPCSGRKPRSTTAASTAAQVRVADPRRAVDIAGDRAAADARACRHLFEGGPATAPTTHSVACHRLRLPSSPPHSAAGLN
ncbi:hypothetical protein STENM327S_05181 [Streptomyces tendae]